MTTTTSTTCDVFISHSVADNSVAFQIANNCEAVGLATFHTGTLTAGTDVSSAIWQALAECRALIAVISAEFPSHAMGMIEIGAATAWNKPVYLIINGPSPTRIPAALSKYPVYPLGRLDEVIQAIRSGFEPLTEDERDSLAEMYLGLATPTDKLSQSPHVLWELTSQFNRRTDKQYSGERLLSELLRMRKKGQLPRLRSRT